MTRPAAPHRPARCVRQASVLRSVPAALAASVLLLSLGCEDMNGRQMPVTKQQIQQQQGPGPAGNAATGQPRSGSASTLGKARDSGLRVQDKVDDHNKAIEDAADEIGK